VPALILAFFAAVGIKQSGFNENTGVVLFGVAFLLIVCLIAYVITMDLKVDDHGISKLFFEKQALFLKWLDVELIKDVEEKSLTGQLIRSFYVIPYASASLSFWSGGRIRFLASMHDFPTFVNEMNRHVRSNNIKIERIRNAEVVICDEISVRDKQTFKLPR
jgi:hypothetical protein